MVPETYVDHNNEITYFSSASKLTELTCKVAVLLIPNAVLLESKSTRAHGQLFSYPLKI